MRVSHKSVLQDFLEECPTRVFRKSVRQECPRRVSHKSDIQKCSQRVSYKSVLQECPTRVRVIQGVPKECPTHVSERDVSNESVSYKSVKNCLSVCFASRPQQAAAQPPMAPTVLWSCHKSCKTHGLNKRLALNSSNAMLGRTLIQEIAEQDVESTLAHR